MRTYSYVENNNSNSNNNNNNNNSIRSERYVIRVRVRGQYRKRTQHRLCILHPMYPINSPRVRGSRVDKNNLREYNDNDAPDAPARYIAKLTFLSPREVRPEVPIISIYTYVHIGVPIPVLLLHRAIRVFFRIITPYIIYVRVCILR